MLMINMIKSLKFFFLWLNCNVLFNCLFDDNLEDTLIKNSESWQQMTYKFEIEYFIDLWNIGNSRGSFSLPIKPN